MQNNKSEAILVLKDIIKEFPAGESTIQVLKKVSLTIKRGEMVAIMGASGSGKSTLMNILGCLDRPTSGNYQISGVETASLEADDLSRLRREHFGFIFQRYNLLGELTALSNVEIPATYAGQSASQRRKRAMALLTRLGMAERWHHRPNQLSGGQQQRVSIARALMNNAQVILADEPTGALDRHSGEEVLRILDELHEEGRTIIIVTHDMNVAARADRIIEISDGVILSDRLNLEKLATKTQEGQAPIAVEVAQSISRFRHVDRFLEAFRMALVSMNAHRMRTFLTMLGVIIGIAAVISMVALGEGTQRAILANFSALGTNTLYVSAGRSPSGPDAAKVTTLRLADAEALAQQSYAAGVTPMNGGTGTARAGNVEANVSVMGGGADIFAVNGLTLVEGSLFNDEDVRDNSINVVIKKDSVKILFPDSQESAVGKTIELGGLPVRIIGVVDQSRFGPPSRSVEVFMPYTAVQSRLTGNYALSSIAVRIADHADPAAAEQSARNLLTLRHGAEDFHIENTDQIRKQINKSFAVFTLLIASIATISLLVGGIGVMNIMLVSVSERISEIGVRMAVGARQGDILQQFLIEAVLVCLVGGGLGIALGMGIGGIFALLDSPFKLAYSLQSIVVAFGFSALIGIGFGFLPARNASRLDPVVALARD